MNNEHGTPDLICSTYCISYNRRHLKYVPVGEIKVSRGDRFSITLEEQLLPEGTKTLYIERTYERSGL